MIPAVHLDLRAHACPITWVKARIALSRLAPGEVLELLLRDGEARENIPRSAEEEGHEVLRLAPAPEEGPGAWRAWLARGASGEVPSWP
ncbi:MAG: sulfurtransferase TusA family protein [Deltaproteobacteria bacterium]